MNCPQPSLAHIQLGVSNSFTSNGTSHADTALGSGLRFTYTWAMPTPILGISDYARLSPDGATASWAMPAVTWPTGIGSMVAPAYARGEIQMPTGNGQHGILRYAYEYARKFRRKKMTIVHKANILKFTGGLFLEVGRKVAQEYPEIETNDKIIDNMCMQLVMNPQQFDVIVTTNLFGDILSDLCSGLVGGLGLAPGANIGYKVALFEAVHGSAPDIAGKKIANPCAMVLAGALLLHHIGESVAATKIQTAVATVIREGKVLTKDLNPAGTASTMDMAEALVRAMG